jgi:hypothetical protein
LSVCGKTLALVKIQAFIFGIFIVEYYDEVRLGKVRLGEVRLGPRIRIIFKFKN